MKQSRIDSGRLVQGIILLGFTAYMIKLLATDEVNNLLSPLAADLLVATAVVMAVHAHDHDHNPKPQLLWALIAAPMVLGFVLPTQSLGSSMINNGLQVAPTQTVELASPAETKTSTHKGDITACGNLHRPFFIDHTGSSALCDLGGCHLLLDSRIGIVRTIAENAPEKRSPEMCDRRVARFDVRAGMTYRKEDCRDMSADFFRVRCS